MTLTKSPVSCVEGMPRQKSRMVKTKRLISYLLKLLRRHPPVFIEHNSLIMNLLGTGVEPARAINAGDFKNPASQFSTTVYQT
jgi:hypothetical protein